MDNQEAQEVMACTTCGAPGTVVGHKNYNVAPDGVITETVVWQCGQPNKMHRWETVNTQTVDAAVVPPPAALLDPHLHQDKNFANLNQPNQSDLPDSAQFTNPDYSETNAHTEDGITIHDGTEDARDENQQFNQDGSLHHEGDSEFSDERPNAGEYTAGGTEVNGRGEDETLDESRTKKTRREKGDVSKKGDTRIPSGDVEDKKGDTVEN